MDVMEYEHGEAVSDGQVVRFYVGTRARPGIWAVVDIEDWPKVNDRKWHGRPRGNTIYVYHTATRSYLHRVVMSPPADMVVEPHRRRCPE